MSQHEPWQLGGNAEELYERYLVPALYPAELGRSLQFLLGAVVIAVNVVVYVIVLRRRPR